MSDKKYVVGIDFGTDSVRSMIIDVANGKEVSSYVCLYKRWGDGSHCNPAKNQFRQHPLDYTESLETAVKNSLKGLPQGISNSIIGIGVDTTGSTPAPVDKDGNILALREDFKDNPNAMFILWKDHTAVDEAEEINRVAKSWGGVDFTKYEGGVYSTEWFWSKILHVLRNDEKVRENAYSWVEHCDWIPAILTGNTDPLKLKRSRCAAGHKAMWHEEWNGLPSEDFLVSIDPLLKGLRERLYTKTSTSDEVGGLLTREWANRLGLKEGISVAVGAFDAHMGAVGSEIKEKSFVMILGTSACDMAVASTDVIGKKLVGGICGQVDGSIIPNMIGLEAGQSSFGDVYAWFKDILSWPLENLINESEIVVGDKRSELIREIEEKIIKQLSAEASKLEVDEYSPVSLDWLNGRRTPYADQKLKGAITGLTLGTDAVKIFKSLVESTAFGAKAIVERMEEEGIEIEEVVASGGIPKKSSYVMQVLSDVLAMPVKVVRSDQSGALGASMFASVAAGIYGSIGEAQKNMGRGFIKTYYSNKSNIPIYERLYKRYKEIGTALENQLRI